MYGGRVVSQIGVGVLTAGTSSLLVPSFAATEQAAWRKSPIQVPDANSLIAAFERGWLGGKTALQGLRSLGVDPPTEDGKRGDDKTRKTMWQACGMLLYEQPDPALLLSMYVRGKIDLANIQPLLKRSGARWSDWQLMVDGARAWIPPAELMVLRNRGTLKDDADFYRLLQLFGGYSEEMYPLFDELRKAMPGISDLTTMAIRETFTPSLAGPLGQYDERPDSIYPFIAAQGLGWSTGVPITDSQGNQRIADWLDMIWAAHWQAISPTQAYTMFHRYRPSQIARYQAQGLNVKPFLISDVQRHLRIADYPLGIRDYLTGIAYNPLRLFDIKNAFFLDVPGADRDWAKERYLDRGLHPDDAETATKLLELQKDERKRLSNRKVEQACNYEFYRQLLDAYELGTVTILQLSDEAAVLGLEPTTIANCVAARTLKNITALTKQVVNAIKKEYLHGGLSDQDADNALLNTNIDATRRAYYVAAWRAMFTLQRKSASRAEVTRWYREGLITREDAYSRLSRMGFVDPDTSLILAESDQQIAKANAAAITAAQRTAQQEARELERQAEKADSLKAKISARLRRIASARTLIKWLKDSRIGPQGFISAMQARDYDNDAIANYLDDEGYEDDANQLRGGESEGELESGQSNGVKG